MRKKKVVAIHFTEKCMLNCPFCYARHSDKTIDEDLFLSLPKYLKQITKQVALGGGEPLMEPELLTEFAKECRKYKLVCNFTTNGVLLREMDIEEIRRLFKNITLVSISYDYWKSKYFTKADWRRFVPLLKRYTKVGVNYLATRVLTPRMLVYDVSWFFGIGVDRFYLLYPKNFRGYEMDNAMRKILAGLTLMYKHFYVDDLTSKLFTEGKKFKSPCHWGRDIVSIDVNGYVYGCSFDKEPIMKLEKAEDVLKINELTLKPRMKCPYLR